MGCFMTEVYDNLSLIKTSLCIGAIDENMWRNYRAAVLEWHLEAWHLKTACCGLLSMTSVQTWKDPCAQLRELSGKCCEVNQSSRGSPEPQTVSFLISKPGIVFIMALYNLKSSAYLQKTLTALPALNSLGYHFLFFWRHFLEFKLPVKSPCVVMELCRITEFSRSFLQSILQRSMEWSQEKGDRKRGWEGICWPRGSPFISGSCKAEALLEFKIPRLGEVVERHLLQECVHILARVRILFLILWEYNNSVACQSFNKRGDTETWLCWYHYLRICKTLLKRLFTARKFCLS